jgi:hypothetical protein
VKTWKAGGSLLKRTRWMCGIWTSEPRLRDRVSKIRTLNKAGLI